VIFTSTVIPFVDLTCATVVPAAFNLMLNEPSVSLELVVAEATEVLSIVIVNEVSSASAGVTEVFSLTVAPTTPEILVGSVVTAVSGLATFTLFLLQQKHMGLQRHHPCIL
jgi:hypothetical protein